jgi:hypothetical protein
MPDKDKVELLLKLADFSWRDYSERRSIEWKTNFALWLALGIFAGFMFQHKNDLSLNIKFLITALLAVTFFIYTFIWKVEIMKRNKSDKKLVKYYWSQVNEELSMEPPALTKQKSNTHISQIAITFIFIFLAALSVWTYT